MRVLDAAVDCHGGRGDPAMTERATPVPEEIKQELTAMRAIVVALAGLHATAQQRVLAYINDRFMPVQITGVSDDD